MSKSTSTPAAPLAISVKEAAVRTSLSVWAVRQAIGKGEIPHVKIGGRILVPVAALEKMLTEKAS